MKLVQELIGYLYGRGKLDDDDLDGLSKEGFYTHEHQPETQSDDEDATEDSEINNDEQPLSIEDIEEQKAAAEDGLSKKGKGKRAFKPEKKWSLEQFNAELLPQIEALDDLFSPLYRLLLKGNKAEIRQILTAPFIIDEDYIKDTLERVLLYHYGQESDLARAVLMTDYLETFFVLTKKLSPKNRDRVREWILGKKFLHPEPYREAIFWARQVLDLQVRILKIWRDLTPSVLNHFHIMGYGKPFLATASEQEDGRLAAQLLMSFIFLHNFDNPKKPETTLFLLLEKEGQDDAYQTMSVFFPSEMHDLWLRVGDANVFDMPYWLHKLNERHDSCLFLETDLWTFDAQKPSLSFGFTNIQNGQKIVLDDTICDKTWFDGYIEDAEKDIVSGVLDLKFDEVGVFSEGLAAVRDGYLWGFIDTRGILVIPCNYKPLPSQKLKFTEGCVACIRASDGKCLYLNKSGKNAFPHLEKQLGNSILFARSFSEGFALVEITENHWQIIDHFGRILLDEETALSISIQSNFSEGFAVFKQITGEFGLISPFGEQFIIENTETESYDYMYSLRESRAAIRNSEGKWGFVDVACRLVIPCIYDWVWSFSEGRSAVCREGLWGYIDVFGHEIIPPQYEMTEHFWNGFGGFKGSEDWGFMDRDGRIVRTNYRDTHVFSENLAIVNKDWRNFLLDTRGNELFVYTFNPANLTNSYFVCLDPGLGLKIMKKDQKAICYISNIEKIHYFAKDFNAFESDRVELFESMDLELSPYTVNNNWCLSEGFIGVQNMDGNRVNWTFAFFDEGSKQAVKKQDVLFHAFYIQNDLYVVDKKQKIGFKIICPIDSYVYCESKTGNRVVLKIGEEAIILRYDLILEKIWKTKV